MPVNTMKNYSFVAAFGAILICAASAHAQLKPSSQLGSPPAATRESAARDQNAPQHDLFGLWQLVWLDTSAVNDVRISEVKAQPTYTDAIGTVRSGNEDCKFEMTVINRIKAIIARPGPPALPDAVVDVPTWVGMRITCASARVFGNGLGGAGTQAAVVGRAFVEVASQPTLNQPWALSRPTPPTAPTATAPAAK